MEMLMDSGSSDGMRGDFKAIAEQAMQYALTPEESAAEEERKLQKRRAERLEHAAPSIMPEDREAIIEGTLALTSALDWVQRLYRYQQRRREMLASGGGAPVGRPFNVLALCGGTGRGKTVAAAWLLAEEGGAYTTADELRRKFSSSHWRDRDWLDGLLMSRCVVLDDVGTELDSRAVSVAMYELVNKRAALAGAYTLITTNLLEEQFRDPERYDQRTIRRIEHAGAIVTVGGQDLRRGGAP